MEGTVSYALVGVVGGAEGRDGEDSDVSVRMSGEFDAEGFCVECDEAFGTEDYVGWCGG